MQEKGYAVFPTNERLFGILEECERIGKRPDSVSLSEELKKVTDEHGERLFKREEWLSSSQIKGYIASYLYI